MSVAATKLELFRLGSIQAWYQRLPTWIGERAQCLFRQGPKVPGNPRLMPMGHRMAEVPSGVKEHLGLQDDRCWLEGV